MAQAGERLRCVLPDVQYGASVATLSIAHVRDGPVLQRVCLDRACGYDTPRARAAKGSSSWWLKKEVGVSALHGAKIPFTFLAESCEAGFLSTFGGALPWCEKCQAGKFSNSRASISCQPCVQGTWAREGATMCTNCPEGTSTPSIGAVSQANCKPACPAGTYEELGRGEGTPTTCVACPRGTFASKSGSPACTQCPYGFTTLDPSPQAGASSCTEACQVGHVGPDGFKPCVACLPGRFSPLPGGEACELCSVGSFSTAGQAGCRECPSTCEMALLSSVDEHTVALRLQCCV